jgi:hypothetical protein
MLRRRGDRLDANDQVGDRIGMQLIVLARIDVAIGAPATAI